jgi:hypothetical protein
MSGHCIEANETADSGAATVDQKTAKTDTAPGEVLPESLGAYPTEERSTRITVLAASRVATGTRIGGYWTATANATGVMCQ